MRCGAARTIRPATISSTASRSCWRSRDGCFGRASVPQGARHAGRRPAAADLAARLKSGYSAQLAAHVGAGFSFAHHFSDFDPVGPMMTYREQFKPSASRDKPLAILAVAAVCADTDAEAERLASTVDLNFVRRRQGRYLPIPSPEEAAARPSTPTDRALIARNRARLLVGSKATVLATSNGDHRRQPRPTNHGHDHDLRPRGAQTLLRAAGRGVRLKPPIQ